MHIFTSVKLQTLFCVHDYEILISEFFLKKNEEKKTQQPKQMEMEGLNEKRESIGSCVTFYELILNDRNSPATNYFFSFSRCFENSAKINNKLMYSMKLSFLFK